MRLLKNKNYLLLRTGWSISSLGTQLQNFAFSLYVLKMTGSSVSFSATLSMQILPMLLFAPLSGYFSDHFNRKKQIILYNLFSTAIIVIFYLLYSCEGALGVWQINLCVFLLAALETFSNSVSGCLMQSAVDPEDYTRQKSVDTGISSIIAISAPALAGVLYGISGIRVVMLLNGVSFLVSCVAEILLQLPNSLLCPRRAETVPMFQSMKEGFHFIAGSSFLKSFLVVLSLLNFILAGMEVGLTVLSQNLMRLSPATIGVEESVLSIGFLLGAAICGVMNRKIERVSFEFIISMDLLVTAAALILACLWLCFAYSLLPKTVNLVLFTAFNFIISMANSILSVNLSARFQREVPNTVMGRVGAFSNAILTACTPLGQVVAGLLLGGFPYFVTYLTEGLLCALLMLGNSIHIKRSVKAKSNG